MSANLVPINTKIEWGGEPPTTTSRGKWEPIFEEFRNHPGEWGKMPERMNNSLGPAIRRGVLVGADKGEFEARSVNQTRDGKCDLWIRYVGHLKDKT